MVSTLFNDIQETAAHKNTPYEVTRDALATVKEVVDGAHQKMLELGINKNIATPAKLKDREGYETFRAGYYANDYQIKVGSTEIYLLSELSADGKLMVDAPRYKTHGELKRNYVTADQLTAMIKELIDSSLTQDENRILAAARPKPAAAPTALQR